MDHFTAKIKFTGNVEVSASARDEEEFKRAILGAAADGDFSLFDNFLEIQSFDEDNIAWVTNNSEEERRKREEYEDINAEAISDYNADIALAIRTTSY